MVPTSVLQSLPKDKAHSGGRHARGQEDSREHEDTEPGKWMASAERLLQMRNTSHNEMFVSWKHLDDGIVVVPSAHFVYCKITLIWYDLNFGYLIEKFGFAMS